jgi:hypothetical protein
MTTDREWDIFMMEIEARNKALIEEFLLGKMRPRDIEALLQQQEQEQLQIQPQAEP